MFKRNSIIVESKDITSLKTKVSSNRNQFKKKIENNRVKTNLIKNIREIFPSSDIEIDKIILASHNLLEDPRFYHFNSPLISSPEIASKMKGTYDGELYYVSGKKKGEVHDVFLSIDLSLKQDEGISGTFNMILSKDGLKY